MAIVVLYCEGFCVGLLSRFPEQPLSGRCVTGGVCYKADPGRLGCCLY